MVRDVADGKCRCGPRGRGPHVSKEVHVVERPHGGGRALARVDHTADGTASAPERPRQLAYPVVLWNAAVLRQKNALPCRCCQSHGRQLDWSETAGLREKRHSRKSVFKLL